MSQFDLKQLTNQMESASAASIIYWAAKQFGNRLAVTSSFQTQSLPLLHLVSRIMPNTPVYFLDTRYHFKETLEYRKQLMRVLGLNVEVLRPLADRGTFTDEEGPLHQTNPNMCCYLKKVEPLQRALAGKLAWISGVRRDQTKARAGLAVFSEQENDRLKICPMLGWTHENVMKYIDAHQLPQHPLLNFGYQSVGCEPCTAPVSRDQDPRSGRWAGSQKTECGLHFDESSKPERIL